MKRLFLLVTILTLVLALSACTTEKPTEAYFDGVSLSEFTIVYSAQGSDYDLRAAEYLKEQIYLRTYHELAIVTDETAPTAHEIVVGETNRPISAALSANTTGVQLSLLARDGSVALEGQGFAIAAAAYYFIDTYVPEGHFDVHLCLLRRS